MKNRLSFRVALCGVLAALMVAIMLLGTIIPSTTYLCPALSGMLLIPVVWEMGTKTGGLLFGAVSLLSLLLAPDKEAALCFLLLFGWYPLMRPKIQHLKKKPLQWVIKILLFNFALVLIFALTFFVLGLPIVENPGQAWTKPLLAGTLALGNLCFVLYDVLLSRVSDLYVLRLRPKLFPHHFP